MQFEIIVGKGKFFMRVPTRSDMAEIRRKRAIFLGAGLQSVTEIEVVEAEACAYVDVLLTDYPDWWEGVSNTVDQNLINTIFNKFLKHYDNFQKKLKKNQW